MTSFAFNLYLFDENIPFKVIRKLRDNGYDVKSVLELLPGEDDEKIVRYAIELGFVIVTLDKDFGELIFRYGKRTNGILFFRIPLATPESIYDKILNYFKNNHFDPIGKFITITDINIRIRDI